MFFSPIPSTQLFLLKCEMANSFNTNMNLLPSYILHFEWSGWLPWRSWQSAWPHSFHTTWIRFKEISCKDGPDFPRGERSQHAPSVLSWLVHCCKGRWSRHPLQTGTLKSQIWNPQTTDVNYRFQKSKTKGMEHNSKLITIHFFFFKHKKTTHTTCVKEILWIIKPPFFFFFSAYKFMRSNVSYISICKIWKNKSKQLKDDNNDKNKCINNDYLSESTMIIKLK